MRLPRPLFQLAISSLVALAACSSEANTGPSSAPPSPPPAPPPPPPSPSTGSVRVTTTTTGEDLDLSAYVVTVGEVVKRIERDDEVTFASLAAGDHDVRLLDVADNCAINGAVTRQVGVTAGNTTEVSFEVSCTALPPAEVDVTGTWTGTFVEVDPETGEEISPVGPLRYELEQDGDEVTVNRIRYVSVEYTGVGRVSGHTLTLFHIGCDSSSTPGGCFGEGSPADGEDKVTSVLEVTGDRMVGAEREQLDHYAIEMELVRE